MHLHFLLDAILFRIITQAPCVDKNHLLPEHVLFAPHIWEKCGYIEEAASYIVNRLLPLNLQIQESRNPFFFRFPTGVTLKILCPSPFYASDCLHGQRATHLYVVNPSDISDRVWSSLLPLIHTSQHFELLSHVDTIPTKHHLPNYL